MLFDWPPRVNLNIRLDKPMVLAGTWVLFLPWVLLAIHELATEPQKSRSILITILIGTIGLFAGSVLFLVTRKYILLRRKKRMR
jgi:hypothetical protein